MVRGAVLWTMHVTDRLLRNRAPGGSPASRGGNTWRVAGRGAALDAPGLGRGLAVLVRAVRRGHTDCSRVSSSRPVVAGDRLLWAWSLVPLGLLSLATVKNAHYAISAQVPWSIWAALALARWENGFGWGWTASDCSWRGGPASPRWP